MPIKVQTTEFFVCVKNLDDYLREKKNIYANMHFQVSLLSTHDF